MKKDFIFYQSHKLMNGVNGGGLGIVLVALRKDSLGTYPGTSLLQARGKRDDARKLLAEGIDPGKTRKEENIAKQINAENQNRLNADLPIINSFEHVANKWLASVAHLVRDITQQKKIKRFEQYVFPAISSMAISELNSPHSQPRWCRQK